ncbi:MAG: AI-2E family transporter [Thermodesulfovibrionales bacterium]
MVNRFYFIVILSLTILFGYLSYQVMKPFLVAIAWAAVITVLFYPLYGLILRYTKWRSVSAMIVLCIILLFIIGPVSYLSIMLVQELKGIMEFAEAGKRQAIKDITGHSVVHSVIEKIISLFDITENELNKVVMDNIRMLGKNMIDGIVKKIRDYNRQQDQDAFSCPFLQCSGRYKDFWTDRVCIGADGPGDVCIGY